MFVVGVVLAAWAGFYAGCLLLFVAYGIRRHDRLGGLLQEYEHAA